MKVIKKLRTPTLVSELVKSKLKRSILDCETRWNSTYDMLQRLLEHKHFCKLMQITSNNWISVIMNGI